MVKVKDFILNNKINLILVFIWFIVVLTAVFFHEAWYDETISFYYVKTHNLSQIFKIIQFNEGHPPLWYLLEFPFAKLGLSFFSVQLTAFLFIFLSVCYFIFKSRFNYFVKITFLFSGGMLYLLPVIARNYSLIPLFVFILADLYPNRHKKPILYAITLVFLSQTHIMTWGFCIICAILFLFEEICEFVSLFKTKTKNINKNLIIRKIAACSILICNFIVTLNFFKYLIFNFRRNSDSINHFDFANTLVLTKENLENFLTYIPVNMYISDILMYIFIFTCLILFAAIFFLNKKSFLILAFTWFSIEYLYIVIYPPTGIPEQKVFIAFVFLIFACWNLEKKNTIIWQIKEITFYLILIFLFFHPFGYETIKDEINNSFSPMPKLIEFLTKNLHDNEQVLFIVDVGNYCYCYIHLPENSVIPLDNRGLTQKADNKFLDEFIKQNNLNIRYIVIWQGVEQELTTPYIKVLKSPENKVSRIKIFRPGDEDYFVYEKKDK